MNYDSAIDSKRRRGHWRSTRRLVPWVLCGLLAGGLALAGCSSQEPEDEKTILQSRSGETTIQVTESNQGGSRVVRVTTTFRGEESTVVLMIDEPVYEVEIPLSIQQQRPAGAGGAAGGGREFSDLLAAQYLEKAQEFMLEGDYNGALRQVNLVLMVQPDNVNALMMKGSVYYAMGNYQLANEQWENVLTVDPSNDEVRNFQDFLKSQQAVTQPNLPGVTSEGVPEPPAAPAPPAEE